MRSAGKRVRAITIGFGLCFTSDWMKKWREFFEPITKRNETKSKQTRFTSGWQLKTLITLHARYKVFEVSWPNSCCAMNSGLRGLGSSPSRS